MQRPIIDGARGRLILSSSGLIVLGRTLPDVVLSLLVVHIFINYLSRANASAYSIIIGGRCLTEPRNASRCLVLVLFIFLVFALLIFLAVAL